MALQMQARSIWVPVRTLCAAGQVNQCQTAGVDWKHTLCVVPLSVAPRNKADLQDGART